MSKPIFQFKYSYTRVVIIDESHFRSIGKEKLDIDAILSDTDKMLVSAQLDARLERRGVDSLGAEKWDRLWGGEDDFSAAQEAIVGLSLRIMQLEQQLADLKNRISHSRLEVVPRQDWTCDCVYGAEATTGILEPYITCQYCLGSGVLVACAECGAKPIGRELPRHIPGCKNQRRRCNVCAAEEDKCGDISHYDSCGSVEGSK